jgi:hypothetical protein
MFAVLATALLGTVAAVATALGGATGGLRDGGADAPRAAAPCNGAEARTVAWVPVANDVPGARGR